MDKPITLKKAQKEKNTILIVISFSFALIVTVFSVLYFGHLVDEGILLSILLVTAILYLFLITYLKSKFVIAMMQYDYLRMVHDDLGSIPLKHPLFTTKFYNNIVETGHELGVEYESFKVFYKLNPKLVGIGKTGKVLTIFITSELENFDFYTDQVFAAIEKVNSKTKGHISKQIIVQFKPYNVFDSNTKEDMNRIINLKNGQMVIVQLTAGFIREDNSLYYLRPVKRYPNKYYYYATKLIHSVVDVKE
ncbi:hypothetical protein N7603_07345 [Acholeplasma vituli]|uniref:Uncharacterized protein n=1 Tax=Paracholeplasma vituli TaxID=69473 RepID=A0ABT2PXA3_9MOLU|nr:hypothetical protein [Paracholeplasma vituli]MCU0105470.1 hypothetical protein [Paracholeplasma vituli]